MIEHLLEVPVNRPTQTPTPNVESLRLAQSREAIRRRRLEEAERYVREGGEPTLACAAGLNLLGLIEEARGDWTQALRLWKRALRVDHRYEPPRRNLQRYFELFQFGRTGIAPAFGDEPRFRESGNPTNG